MAAHLRDIRRRECAHWGCHKPATKTLYNTHNAEINSYCNTHATKALKDFQRRHESEGQPRR